MLEVNRSVPLMFWGKRNLNSVFGQTINQKWGQNKGFKVYLSCVLSEEVLKTVHWLNKRLKQETSNPENSRSNPEKAVTGSLKLRAIQHA